MTRHTHNDMSSSNEPDKSMWRFVWIFPMILWLLFAGIGAWTRAECESSTDCNDHPCTNHVCICDALNPLEAGMYQCGAEYVSYVLNIFDILGFSFLAATILAFGYAGCFTVPTDVMDEPQSRPPKPTPMDMFRLMILLTGFVVSIVLFAVSIWACPATGACRPAASGIGLGVIFSAFIAFFYLTQSTRNEDVSKPHSV